MANVLEVILKGDAKHLNSSLGKASAKLKNFGEKTTAIGRNLSTRLSLPLALAGGAAVKMSLDFERSMTKITTLVGVAADEVGEMSNGVKALASEAGISAGEAADALFFITSAGLRGAEAMAVLEQSLKASAVGLGETKTIADLSTSAINAFGSENITAAQATDVLVASVREGKLEADELAGAMGRVLPIASNMGISFNEVGAAFAAMSRTGTNANEAATQLRGILASILKPTSQAKEMLGKLGLSAEGLRSSLKEDGLLSTLEILKQRFEGNDEAAQLVFGNVRALTGIMDLLGASVDTTRQIFENMTDVTGTTAKSFEDLQQSGAFELDKAIAQLKNTFTDLGAVIGETIIPIVIQIATKITNVVKKFSGLDDATKKIIVVIGALATVLPPLLIVFGSIASAIGSITLAFGALNIATGGLIVALGLLVTALIAVGKHKSLVNTIKDLNVELAENSRLAKEAALANDGTADAAIKLYKAEKELLKTELKLKKAQQDKEQGMVASLLGIESKEYKRLAKEIEATELKIKNYDTAILGLENSLKSVGTQAKQTKKDVSDLSTVSGLTLEDIELEVQLNLEAKAFVKEFDETIGDFLSKGETFSDVFNKKITDAFDPDSVPVMDEFFPELPEEDFAFLDDYNKKTKEFQENMASFGQTVGSQVAGSFAQLGDAIVTSMGLGEGALASFTSAFITAAMDAIGAALAQAVASAIASASAGSLLAGPAAPIVLPALIAGTMAVVKGAFSSNVPKFANGGIVSAPTLGLFGEYAGAKSNPEVVAPLDKLKGMIGQRETAVNVTGGFRLEGQDLVMALQRADRNRSRLL